MGTVIPQPVIDMLLMGSWLFCVLTLIYATIAFITWWGSPPFSARYLQLTGISAIISVFLFLAAHSNQILRLPTS